MEEYQRHPLQATARSIAELRDTLTERLDKWREVQSVHMPSIRDVVDSQGQCAAHEELLFLPSALSKDEHQGRALNVLAQMETELRKGQALDCILKLRRIMKSISSTENQRRKEVRGQKEGTRSNTKAHELTLVRDIRLAIYNAARSALLSLGGLTPDSRQFPHLSVADLFRKSTYAKRSLGATYRPDGEIWGLGNPEGTTNGPDQTHRSHSEDGKLWSHIAGLSDAEVLEWEMERKSQLNSNDPISHQTSQKIVSSGIAIGRKWSDGWKSLNSSMWNLLGVS
jgi:hypothetical protein